MSVNGKTPDERGNVAIHIPEVTAPSTDPSAAGKAADAKATGDAVSRKADKAAPQAAGNFAALAQDGNLVDSGKKPSDFQPTLTFDQTPTSGSTNPVTSNGIARAVVDVEARAKTAEDAASYAILLAQDAGHEITAINEKIPSGASAQNKLVDTATMNSSIATNTATFRGTYNLVTDLELSVAATREQTAVAVSRKMEVLSISPDNNDYCFVQIPTKDETPAEISRVDRYKCVESEQGGAKVVAWEYEWSLNNSSFTAAQWAAINSGITSGAVAKLDALPTAEELSQALAGKMASTATGADIPVDATQGAQMINAALSGKASTADATLTEGYSDWVIDVQSYPDGYTGHSELYRHPVYDAWRIDWTGGPEILTTTIPGAADSLSISLDDSGVFGHIAFSATRHPILTLGSQSDKPIQPAGDYLAKEDVVAPSNTAVTGQAADAAATYNQLTNKINKSGGTMTGELTVPNLTVGSRASGSTIGTNSTAEGSRTTASGNYSHAEGGTTTASGDYSHAEGGLTTASGENSHAEGGTTTASGDDSHAEGYHTTASGEDSHAEGGTTTASGDDSHAEGYHTTASGEGSHAEGYHTIAQNDSEHAQGQYNASHKASTTFGNAGNTLSSIGFGTADNARKNAVETMQDGKTYIYGLGNYNGTNPAASGVKDLATAVEGKLNKSGGAMDITYYHGPLTADNQIVFAISAQGAYIGFKSGGHTIYINSDRITIDDQRLALAAANPTAGNLAALDAQGNPTNSGIKASDKLDAASAAPAFDATRTAQTKYTQNELVSKDGVVYKCTNANGHYGAWNASNWTAKPVSDLFLPLTGGTMTGTLTAPKFNVQNGATGGFCLNYGDYIATIYYHGATGVYIGVKQGSSGTYYIKFQDNGGTVAFTAGTGHNGNLAALDANGNPVDSGKSLSDISQEIQDAVKYAVVVDDKLVPIAGPDTSVIETFQSGVTTWLSAQLPDWSSNANKNTAVFRNRSVNNNYYYNCPDLLNRVVLWIGDVNKDAGQTAGYVERSLVFPKAGVYSVDVEYAVGLTYQRANAPRFLVSIGDKTQEVVGTRQAGDLQKGHLLFSVQAGSGTIRLAATPGLGSSENAAAVVIAALEVTLVKEIGIEIGDIVAPDANARTGQAADAKATTAFVQREARYALIQSWNGVTPPGGNTVSKYTLSAATATLNVAASATFTSGRALDFIVDIENTYSSSGTPAQATIDFGGLGSDWYAVVNGGEDLSDMTTLAAGEMARFHFTQTAFTKDSKPVLQIVKQVVTDASAGGGSYQIETDGTVTTDGELNADGTLTMDGELNADGTLTVEAI